MLIDKINIRSKSLNRLPFIFTPEDKNLSQEVDAIKTFKDVVDLAKELLDFTENKLNQLKKLPDFDQHIAKNYDLNDEESDDDTEDSNAVQESDDNSDAMMKIL